jgi:hypothetical protein
VFVMFPACPVPDYCTGNLGLGMVIRNGYQHHMKIFIFKSASSKCFVAAFFVNI